MRVNEKNELITNDNKIIDGERTKLMTCVNSYSGI